MLLYMYMLLFLLVLLSLLLFCCWNRLARGVNVICAFFFSFFRSKPRRYAVARMDVEKNMEMYACTYIKHTQKTTTYNMYICLLCRSATTTWCARFACTRQGLACLGKMEELNQAHTKTHIHPPRVPRGVDKLNVMWRRRRCKGVRGGSVKSNNLCEKLPCQKTSTCMII